MQYTQESRMLQGVAVKRLQEIKPDALTPALLLRYLIEAAGLERHALHEPEVIEEQARAGRDNDLPTLEELPKLTNDELMRIIVKCGGLEIARPPAGPE